MSTHKLTAAVSIFAVNFGCLAAGPNLGKPIDSAEIAAWDISIPPDGTGLPSGSGTPAQGVPVYAQKRSEEHTSELQSLAYLVCRLLLEKKKKKESRLK